MSTQGIEVRNNESESRFECSLGDSVAVAEYDREGDRIVFTHTEVPEAMGGRAIAAQLVKRALDYAREEKLTVVPQCSYVAAFIRKNPEYGDLLEDAKG